MYNTLIFDILFRVMTVKYIFIDNLLIYNIVYYNAITCLYNKFNYSNILIKIIK